MTCSGQKNSVSILQEMPAWDSDSQIFHFAKDHPCKSLPPIPHVLLPLLSPDRLRPEIRGCTCHLVLESFFPAARAFLAPVKNERCKAGESYQRLSLQRIKQGEATPVASKPPESPSHGRAAERKGEARSHCHQLDHTKSAARITSSCQRPADSVDDPSLLSGRRLTRPLFVLPNVFSALLLDFAPCPRV